MSRCLGAERAIWLTFPLAHTDFHKTPVFLDANDSGEPVSRRDLQISNIADRPDCSLGPGQELPALARRSFRDGQRIRRVGRGRPAIGASPFGIEASARANFHQLQHHARETLALLEDSGRDHFAEIFAHDQTGMLKAFDEVVR